MISGLVDPGRPWEREDFGISASREALGMFHAGCCEGRRTFPRDAGGVALVHFAGVWKPMPEC